MVRLNVTYNHSPKNREHLELTIIIGDYYLPQKGNNIKLFLKNLKYPSNESMPWKFSFYWLDQGACKLIDNSNCFADQDSTPFQKTAVWNTAELRGDAMKPYFPPENSVLQVSLDILEHNHAILQQALYPIVAPQADQPMQFAPQATLNFRLFDPLPVEIAPYVQQSDILDLLSYDKQFVNHTAFAVPNPKSAQAVKNFLIK